MSTPSNWDNLEWGMSGKELEKVLQTNSLDELFPDKDGVIYMAIDIPKDIQKEFDMHGSILLTKDELKKVEMELNNDGSENDAANMKKYGSYGHKQDSMHGSLKRGKVKADRYGKEL